MVSQNLDKIIAMINNSHRRICLFLGAGADISSGGKLFSNVKKSAINLFTEYNAELMSESMIDKQFEETMDSVPQLHSREILLEEINTANASSIISDGYKFLVLMAKYGLIDAVVTTNFYDYLEKAQQEMLVDVFDIWSNDDKSKSIEPAFQKTLYLKLHGDVTSRHVTHLTQNEIERKVYPKKVISKLKKIFQEDMLIFIGYSGMDGVLTDVISKVGKAINCVFWINPSFNNESSLINLLSNNMVYGKYTFDEFVMKLALSRLGNINLDVHEQPFIYGWIKAKSKRSLTNIVNKNKIVIERPECDALKTQSRFCILSGKSGIGKTCVVEYYIKNIAKNEILYINAEYNPCISIIERIVSTLGYNADSPLLVLYNLCIWCAKNKVYLTFVIDGIVEQSCESIEELVTFINTVKNNGFIRFILVSRATMIVKKISQFVPSNDISSILVRPFSTDEILALAKHYKLENHIEGKNIEYMQDPLVCDLMLFFLSNSHIRHGNFFESVETAFSERLNKKPQLLHDYLIDIAKSEYLNAIPSEESIQYITDTGLLSQSAPHYFKHDIFKTYYLQEYLFRNEVERNNSIDNLLKHLHENIRPDNKLYNAYLIHYIISEETNVRDHLLELNQILCACCTIEAIAFCRNCILHYAKYYPLEYCSALNSLQSFEFHDDMTVSIIEGVQTLVSDDMYYNAIVLFQNHGEFIYDTTLYSIDRFCTSIMQFDNEHEQNKYFITYSAKVFSGSVEVKLYKLIYALMRLDIEKYWYSCIEEIINLITSTMKCCSPDRLLRIIIKYSYNILFNSGSDIEADFQSIAFNSKLMQIMSDVVSGEALDSASYLFLLDLTANINNMCVFMLSNLIVILSMQNDQVKTMSMAKQIVDTNDHLLPENLDFLFSSVFMSLYYCNPNNRDDFVEFFETALKKHEVLLFSQPVNTRKSTYRRFSEEFERIFEDGFNPLAFLFYTSNLEDESNRLHQYYDICNHLCNTGNINKILVIVHAVGQMISIFPREGFSVLANIVKYSDHPIVRKGIIRILQENMIRYPVQTHEFINEHLNLSDSELTQTYKKAQNIMIRSRTLEQLHWCRFLYICQQKEPELIKKILISITKSRSLKRFIALMIGQGTA